MAQVAKANDGDELDVHKQHDAIDGAKADDSVTVYEMSQVVGITGDSDALQEHHDGEHESELDSNTEPEILTIPKF